MKIKLFLLTLTTAVFCCLGLPIVVNANTDISTAISVVNQKEIEVSVSNTSDKTLSNLSFVLDLPDGLEIDGTLPEKEQLSVGEEFTFRVNLKDQVSPIVVTNQKSQEPITKKVLPRTGERLAITGTIGFIFLVIAFIFWKSRLGRQITLLTGLLFVVGLSLFNTATVKAERRQIEVLHSVQLSENLTDIKLTVLYDYPEQDKKADGDTILSSEQAEGTESSEKQETATSSSTEIAESASSQSGSATSSSDNQGITPPTPPTVTETTDPEVIVSGYAYDSNGQALNQESLLVLLDGQEVHTLITEEDGYFYLQALTGRHYTLRGSDFDVDVVARAEGDYQIINKTGTFSLGKLIQDETTKISVLPEVVYVEDFTLYEIADNTVTVDKSYDFREGDKIILPPSADFNTGVAYRVKSSEVVNGQTIIVGEQITDLSEVTSEIKYADTITSEELIFEPADGFVVDSEENGERSVEVSLNSIKGTLDLGDGVSIALRLGLDINPDIDIRWLDLGNSKVLVTTKLDASIIGGLAKNISPDPLVFGEVSQLPKRTQSRTFTLGKIHYTTPLGAQLTGEVSLFVYVGATGGVSVEAGIVFENTIGFNQGRLLLENQPPKPRLGFKAEGGVETRFGTVFSPGIALFGQDLVKQNNQFGYEVGLGLEWRTESDNKGSLYLTGKGNPFYSASIELPLIRKVKEEWGYKEFGKVIIPPEAKYDIKLYEVDKGSGSTQPSRPLTSSNPERENQGNQSTELTSPPMTSSDSDFIWRDVEGGVEITDYYRTSSTTLVIPSQLGGRPVVSIGDVAFNDNYLTSVVIPDSVTSIGDSAFSINQLTSVVIPSSVTNIGDNAFSNNQLTSIVIPSSVTSIGNAAFANNQLTSVVIPSSVTSIGVNTFSNNQLTSVAIPSSVTSIGDNAFSENQLTSVVIPPSVTSIRYGAFSNNQLTSVVIPPSVTSIGNAAFAINQLTSVVIPSSVTNIGDNAFSNNQLTSIIIPSSVTSLGNAAFTYNPLLTFSVPNHLGNSNIGLDSTVKIIVRP